MLIILTTPTCHHLLVSYRTIKELVYFTIEAAIATPDGKTKSAGSGQGSLDDARTSFDGHATCASCHHRTGSDESPGVRTPLRTSASGAAETNATGDVGERATLTANESENSSGNENANDRNDGASNESENSWCARDSAGGTMMLTSGTLVSVTASERSIGSGVAVLVTVNVTENETANETVNATANEKATTNTIAVVDAACGRGLLNATLNASVPGGTPAGKPSQSTQSDETSCDAHRQRRTVAGALHFAGLNTRVELGSVGDRRTLAVHSDSPHVVSRANTLARLGSRNGEQQRPQLRLQISLTATTGTLAPRNRGSGDEVYILDLLGQLHGNG